MDVSIAVFATGVAIPTEFDVELQSECERWLRRRLLWLCMVGIVVTALLDLSLCSPVPT